MLDLPLLSARLILRRLVPADLPEFQSYRRDADVGRYQGWTAQSDAQALDFLTEMSMAEAGVPGAWFQVGIAERDVDRLIGDIGLCRRTAEDGSVEAEIGYSLAASSQGQGLASEALRLLLPQLGAARVVAVTDGRNRASIRLLARLGGRCVASEAASFRGEACVEHRYVIDVSTRPCLPSPG